MDYTPYIHYMCIVSTELERKLSSSMVVSVGGAGNAGDNARGGCILLFGHLNIYLFNIIQYNYTRYQLCS